MRFLLTFFVTAAVAACTPTPSAAPIVPSRPEASHRPETPMFVEWRVRSMDANTANLTAAVVRRAEFTEPIRTRLTIPDGVELLSGDAETIIPAGTPAGETLLEYAFRYTQPAGKLRIHADLGSGRIGVHAADDFSFGAPPEAPRPPPKRGEPVIIDGRNLGRPIEIR